MLTTYAALIAFSGRRVRAASRDRGGQLVEYGLLVALIAAVCVVAIAALGGGVADNYGSVANRI